jgi:hypothetical protein
LKNNVLKICFLLFGFIFLIVKNVGMGDVAASVGFAGWAFAAMCDHALFLPFSIQHYVGCRFYCLSVVAIAVF